MLLTGVKTDAKVLVKDIFNEVEEELVNSGYEIIEKDNERPWGGYLRVREDQAPKFVNDFYHTIDLPESTQDATLSPKILLFYPGHKRLSWQVHDRRAEFWRVMRGPLEVYLSDSDIQPDEPQIFTNGEVIDMSHGTRHRGAGVDRWAIVAEIWIHTDADNPSDESDIRRISDDFGR